MMTKDDPRYDEWPSRKPSKKTLRENRIEEGLENVGLGERLTPDTKKALASVAAAAAPKALGRAAAAVRVLRKVNIPVSRAATASTVALGAPGTLGLIAAVGLGSYALTRYVIDNFPTKERRLQALSIATGKFRGEKARQLGRQLTKAEQEEISATYKAARDKILKSPI